MYNNQIINRPKMLLDLRGEGFAVSTFEGATFKPSFHLVVNVVNISK